METAAPKMIEGKMTAWIHQGEPIRLIRQYKTSRLLAAGLFFLLIHVVAVLNVSGQSSFEELQFAFDNGHFGLVIEKASSQIAKTGKIENGGTSLEIALLSARALIALEKYDEASQLLDRTLSAITEVGNAPEKRAAVYFTYSAIFRARREFRLALEFAKKARLASPESRRVECEYNLSIGRILYSAGYDLSAIIWFEKAEKLFGPSIDPGIRFDVYRHLSLAWKSKFHYAKAIRYSEKLIATVEKTRFKYKHRVALFDHSDILNVTGQKKRADLLLNKALSLAVAENDTYQSRVFLSSLLLGSLYDGDIATAAKYLNRLDRIDTERRFECEVLLGRAVIATYRGDNDLADRFFARLAALKQYSDHIVPYWKSTIALRSRDWEQLLAQNLVLKKVSEEGNFREDLPGIHLSLARAYLGLGRSEEAIENALKGITIVDSGRPAGDTQLSLSLLETYHSLYRLLAELRLNDPSTSFALADQLKSRVLKDRIENSILRQAPEPSQQISLRLAELSAKFVNGAEPIKEIEDAIGRLERSATIESPDKAVTPPNNFVRLNELPTLVDTEVVSYFFTIDGGLLAHVWRKSAPVQIVEIPMTEEEADKIALATHQKIKNLVFFKKDGKELFDRLLRPLGLNAKHLIVVPDRSLWKIPFHALSPDGQSYLIENTLVSYAPSVGSLLDAVAQPPAKRKSIHVFANNSYRNLYLPHVNREAENVAKIFGTRPTLGARAADFLGKSEVSDILHFSMHAEVDAERPLESFLAFRPTPTHDGRLSVNDLLSLRIKKQSFVFLASCDTNNVLNGEGIVSVAWAMMGSGATSVVSSQWEANDRASEMFTDYFYNSYSLGNSVAESMQAAARAMIKNKSAGSHEPYFWAAFALQGDYR